MICIESLKSLYQIYIVETKYISFILTYKISQDHLELFFGAIRSKGGYNNNPTVRQYQAAYKQLLVHTQICAPNTGNTINLEEITILTCSSSINRGENGNLEESPDYIMFLEKAK